MTSRREFLKVGLTASALPIAARAELPFAVASQPVVPLYKVLYDTRFTASVAFGQRAGARGLAVHAIDGDITRIWYDDLYHRWREGAVAIAGLTARGALFCLERLAWDQRLRVVFRGEHTVAGTHLAHVFEGPASLVPTAATAAAGRSWAADLADVVGECPLGRLERHRAGTMTAGAAALPSETLYSWVIAPVVRA
jgi:hypothetical protein